MTGMPAPPFAAQRLICIALLAGMGLYGGVVAVLLAQQEWRGIAEAPIELLDTITPIAGGALLVAATVLRMVLRSRAAASPADLRPALSFQATLMSVAMLEGGVLLAVTAWLLNGNPMPHVAVAAVLFAVTIVFVPFSDPDA